MRDVNTVLDSIKSAQKIGSDYKLAMVLGMGASNLRNYRRGRSLPDAKTCGKLAEAMGEKPDLLMVEMEAQRARDDETKELWASLAKRLQAGFANVKMMVLLAIFSLAAIALPALLTLYFAVSTVGASVYYVKRIIRVIYARMTLIVKLCKAGLNVPRHAHAAPFLPA